MRSQQSLNFGALCNLECDGFSVIPFISLIFVDFCIYLYLMIYNRNNANGLAQKTLTSIEISLWL